MFDALAVAGKGRGAINFVNSNVERVMCLAQTGRHYVWIVKIGERRAWMRCILSHQVPFAQAHGFSLWIFRQFPAKGMDCNKLPQNTCSRSSCVQ